MPTSYRKLVAEIQGVGMKVVERGNRRANGSHAEVQTHDGHYVTVLTHHGSNDSIQNAAVKAIARSLRDHLGDEFDMDAWVASVTGRPMKKAAAE